MSKLMDKLRRMDPYHANSKQKILKDNIQEPAIDLSNLPTIEERFEGFCAKQAQQLVNFELKSSQQQQQDDVQIQVNQRGKFIRSNLKQKSTLIGGHHKRGSIRQSVVIQLQDDEIIENQIPFLSNNKSTQNLSGRRTSEFFQKRTATYQRQKKSKNMSKSQVESNSNLRTQASLTSFTKLSPLKIEKGVSNTSSNNLNSPEKRLTRLFEQRNTQQNIRFKNKKATVIFQNTNQEQKKNADDTSDFDERICQSPEWIQIQQKLKNSIKNKKSDKDDDFINPVVKMFGNVRNYANIIIYYYNQLFNDFFIQNYRNQQLAKESNLQKFNTQSKEIILAFQLQLIYIFF